MASVRREYLRWKRAMLDILVVGKSGQLARCLRDLGSGEHGFNLQFWGRDELDLAVPSNIKDAVEQRSPDVVINVAAYTSVDAAEADISLAHQVNGIAPGALSEGAFACGASILHISTDYVFDGKSRTAYLEEDETNPLNVYGASKLIGEEKVARCNPHHIILRTSWLYSQYRSNFVKKMIELSSTHEHLNVVDDQLGNPTSAFDLAQAIFQILHQLNRGDKTAPYGLYHVAGHGLASWFDVADCTFSVLQRLGRSVPKLTPIVSEQFPTSATRPQSSRLNCSKFEENFNYTMPYWSESLRKTVEWICAVRAPSV